MADLPGDLPWRDFERVLRILDYQLFKAGAGSARTYRNPNRDPEFVTFHEPHGKRGIPKGTLRSYVRQLQMEKEEFMDLL
jgi:predicted RNA binding protein YcfA (HicA-like mRNA interferase family)